MSVGNRSETVGWQGDGMWMMRSVCMVVMLGMWLGGYPLAARAEAPGRILSMAPNATEILYALGLGPRLVGVTRFCDYPEEARRLPQAGGYMDPNYEVVLGLQPDLVILLDTHTDVKRQLERLRLRTLSIPYATVADIHASIRLIGDACGAGDAATRMIAELERRQAAVRSSRQGGAETPQRVLVCIGRDLTVRRIAGLYIAGRNGFYDELLELVGGENVYRDERVAYPQISAEGVISLNPDVIIDLVSQVPDGRTEASVRGDWEGLHPVSAVREGRVFVVTGDDALRPGPRYIRFLEQLADLLAQPGVDTDE